jgi:hypothetical protein
MTNYTRRQETDKNQNNAEPMPKPAVHVCPYLGSWEDPVTARSYVTHENCCYHVKPAATVKAEHQRTYCLTYQHTQCPIYRHQTEINLPARRLPATGKAQILIPALILCIIFIVAMVLLAGAVW